MTTITWVIRKIRALSITARSSGSAPATEALVVVGTRHTRWATSKTTRSCSGRARAAFATKGTLSIIETHPLVASVNVAVGVETGISLCPCRRGSRKAADDKAEQKSQPCTSHMRLQERGVLFKQPRSTIRGVVSFNPIQAKVFG